jgi:MoaA/NifB/PqqE/SkfB family radical SAM enzyme
MHFPRYQHAPLGTAWKIVRGRFGSAPVPLAVNLLLTYRCNLRCAYCAVWQDPPAEMDTATVCRLIDEMAALGTERLGIGGGEPMLRKDLGAIVAHAKQRGLTVNLVSNGLQIPERVQELEGLDFLAVSLDGPEELHDEARGKGSHARALRAIDAARKAGIEVWTTTVLTRLNLGCIPALLEEARRLGVRASFLPVMEEGLKSRNAPDLAPDVDAFVRAMDDLLAEKARPGTPLAMSHELLRFYRDKWGRSHPERPRGAWQGGSLACQAGKLFCSVAPDGGLYPCNYLQDAARGPDAVELGFAEALRRLRPPDCAGCWCDSFTESNLIYAFRPDAVLNALALLRNSPASA